MKSKKVKIELMCCDAPVKSFVLRVKGHSGFFIVHAVYTKVSIYTTVFVFLTTKMEA